MTNKICDACETVDHCSKHGCIPLTSPSNGSAMIGYLPNVRASKLPRMIDASQDRVSDADIAAIRHTLMTGLAHNPAITALYRIAADRALQKTLWTHCVFDGPPPDGYTDWHAFVDAPVKTGVTVRKTAEKPAAAVPVEMPVVAWLSDTNDATTSESFALLPPAWEPMVKQADALASLAAKDAEIARLKSDLARPESIEVGLMRAEIETLQSALKAAAPNGVWITAPKD